MTLSETADDLRATARSLGWSLDGVEVFEQPPTEEALTPDAQNTMFRPDEFELGEATGAVLAAVERIRPARLVIDSLSDIRHLSQTPLRFRRQVLGLRQFFRGRGCTLLLDERAEEADQQLQGVVRGVISLERRSPEYGKLRRRLRVAKMRGQAVRTGYHDFTIGEGAWPSSRAW